MFLSSCDRNFGVPTEFQQESQASSLGRHGTLLSSSLERKLRIPLELKQGNKPSSGDEQGILCFFMSCSRKIGFPLELPWGPQENSCVASGKSGILSSWRGTSQFLSSRCRGLGPHLEARLETTGTSPVMTGILGFLSSFKRGVRLHFMLRHGTTSSYRVVQGVSGLLSS